MQRRKTSIILALIVVAAGVPRCRNVWREGVEDGDGANLTLEAQLVVNVLDGFWHKVTSRPYALPKLDQLRGRALGYAKPLYTLSLVPGWFMGIPRTNIASLFSAFWGLAIIPIVYRIGRDLWGPREGLYAAAAYGASGFAAFYTRIAAAESFGFFCLAIALWQYVRLYEGAVAEKPLASAGGEPGSGPDTLRTGRKSKLQIWFPMFVGFLWALAILANYRLLLTVAVMLTVCELLAIIRCGPRNLVRSAIIAAALFGTLLATELAFRIAVHAWRGIGGEFHASTYWEQLRFFLFEKRPVGTDFM
jgi:Dolichyl-phosphate-mannose-protein mannosyltransferase